MELLYPDLPPRSSHFPKLLPPEILDQRRLLAHNAGAIDLEALSKTSRGTPFFIPSLFTRRSSVVLGLIDPGKFIRYTGGVKCGAIGLAGSKLCQRSILNGAGKR